MKTRKRIPLEKAGIPKYDIKEIAKKHNYQQLTSSHRRVVNWGDSVGKEV